MVWDQDLSRLRDALAKLYPEHDDAVRLVTESGLPREHIAFKDTAYDTWFSVLSEADARDSLDALVAIAAREYPESPELTEARAGYDQHRPLRLHAALRSLVDQGREREVMAGVPALATE